MQLPETRTMTIQLIGKDDSSFDDSEVLTDRWQAYVLSYISVSGNRELWVHFLIDPFRAKQQMEYLLSKSSSLTCVGASLAMLRYAKLGILGTFRLVCATSRPT